MPTDISNTLDIVTVSCLVGIILIDLQLNNIKQTPLHQQQVPPHPHAPRPLLPDKAHSYTLVN